MSASNPVVLFAVNESTRNRFLPGFDAKKLPAFREEWVDFSNLNPGDWEKLLIAKRPEVLVTCWETPSIPEKLALDENFSLRYVCHLTGGVKGVVTRNMIARGILVSNWGGTISHTIAEHALLLTLGALRGMPLWRPHMESPALPAKATIPTRSLRGKKVGIHGFGAIVRHLIALLNPFGVSISSYSAGVPAGLFKEQGVRRCETLEELASDCDIFIELEALTPQSRGSVDARILGLLRAGTVFVNVGRGAVIDEAALADLAASGKITVALDVYTKEPLPLDSPLMKNPATLLSPHIAGPTQDALPLCGDFALSNLRRYLSGHPDQIEGVVTLEIYDRTT
jgi:phosphoglycerate dehydrogenase-like enzyme